MDELLDRYAPEDLYVFGRFFGTLAMRTRKTGKISGPRKEKIVASFARFDADVVIASLKIYLEMDVPAARGGGGKNENYVLGIMANKQAEKDGRVGRGGGKGIGGADRGADCGESGEGEGERIRKLAESAGERQRGNGSGPDGGFGTTGGGPDGGFGDPAGSGSFGGSGGPIGEWDARLDCDF